MTTFSNESSSFSRLSRTCLLQGWEFLQKEELDQDNGLGQKVSEPPWLVGRDLFRAKFLEDLDKQT